MALTRKIAWLLAPLSVFVLLTDCASVPTPLRRTGIYLDTVVTLSLYDTQDPAVLDTCFEKIADWENLFSRTRAESDVARINRAAGQPVAVDEETARLLAVGLEYGKRTGGALDITIASASSLWNFQDEEPAIPDSRELQQAASHVDWQTVQLDGRTVQLTDPQAQIDLGAIAKGYIADGLAAYLREQGVERALLDLGGNIYALGDKNGQPWTVGVRDPLDGDGLAATVPVRDGSVVTSGIYERGFERDGVRYHHLLDPHTGWPVQNGLASVTILSASSVEGDALSTACFVLGEEDGLALIEKTEGVEALFIRTDGTQVRSSGFPTEAGK